ncbi:unnamed protein product [Citrullus colocynthis]|uniref:Uncharacterized protein n=1 Tax=Citrullus colocynthis TaxID=252529 RepID=A0ABP0Y504_9ROSI
MGTAVGTVLKLRGNSNLSSLERRDSPEEREKADSYSSHATVQGKRRNSLEIEVSATRECRHRRRWEPRSCVGQSPVRRRARTAAVKTVAAWVGVDRSPLEKEKMSEMGKVAGEGET